MRAADVALGKVLADWPGALEEVLGCCPLLQQHIQFGTVFIDHSQ